MNYVLRRLAATLPVMTVVAVVVFLLIHLSPGDPAALIAGWMLDRHAGTTSAEQMLQWCAIIFLIAAAT